MNGSYWVGQIPTRPITLTLRYSPSGEAVNLIGFNEVAVKMLGANNEEIDMTGSQTLVMSGADGRIMFIFPANRSLFTQPGEYVFQVELGTEGGRREFTSLGTINVKQRGIR